MADASGDNFLFFVCSSAWLFTVVQTFLPFWAACNRWLVAPMVKGYLCTKVRSMRLEGRTESAGHIITAEDEQRFIAYMGDMVTDPVSKGAVSSDASLEGVAALWLPSIVGAYSAWTLAVTILTAIEMYTKTSGLWGMWNLYVLAPYFYILVQLSKTWCRIGGKIDADLCNDTALMGMWETHKRML